MVYVYVIMGAQIGSTGSCCIPYTAKFRGAQFLRIAISKHFVETIFADQEFRVYGIQKFLMGPDVVTFKNFMSLIFVDC